MQKAILKAINTLGTVVLTLALVAVLGTLAKAEQTPAQIKAEQKAKLREANNKAINKLIEDTPTDQELIGNVALVKHTHIVEEEFSCSVALADRAELQQQLKHSSKLSKERKKEYYSTLQTVTQLIRKNKCKG